MAGLGLSKDGIDTAWGIKKGGSALRILGPDSVNAIACMASLPSLRSIVTAKVYRRLRPAIRYRVINLEYYTTVAVTTSRCHRVSMRT